MVVFQFNTVCFVCICQNDQNKIVIDQFDGLDGTRGK